MKILSWNVNGIRSVHEKGFLEWFRKEDADLVCLQEIKAEEEKIPRELKEIAGYKSYFSPAERPGYSGVAIYTKRKPERVEKTLGPDQFDREGRILLLEFSEFLLLNLYIPHGGRKKENLSYKLSVYDTLLAFLEKEKGKPLLVIGDFNIAHKEIDLARPKENEGNVMFTKEEREKLDLLENMGFSDTYRLFETRGGRYTWWPYWANARQRNLGWRIDYAWVSEGMRSSVRGAFIQDSVQGSDHCPIGVEIG